MTDRTSHPAEQSEPTPDHRTGRPELLVIGEGASAVMESLRSLRVKTRAVPGLLHDRRRTPIGVVLAGVQRESGVDVVRSLGTRWPDVPVYVLVPLDPPRRRVAELYDAGASGVFEWPQEREVLSHYLAEMLSLRMTRGRSRKADTALARVVRTHLRTLLPPAAVPRVDARSGAIYLSGELDSLALEREIERCVEGIPGVRDLDTRRLYVVPEPVPDARIRQSLRRVLEKSPIVDERTLSISVDAGQITLMGTAADRRELEHIRDLATHLRGVRSVEVKILVSSRAQEEDRGAAQRLNRVIADLFGGQGLSVAFYRGVAVISGRVRNLRTKRSVEAFIAEDDAVARVVNKLEIAGK